jgi:hypothetical protein
MRRLLLLQAWAVATFSIGVPRRTAKGLIWVLRGSARPRTANGPPTNRPRTARGPPTNRPRGGKGGGNRLRALCVGALVLECPR